MLRVIPNRFLISVRRNSFLVDFFWLKPAKGFQSSIMVIYARFSKTGEMRYLSHLDLLRLFQRVARRANLPISITKGFNPHMRISINKALKLGLESRDERVTFYLDKEINAGVLMDRLNHQLPPGIRILDAKNK